MLENGWIYNGVWYDSDARSVQNMAGTQTMINSGFTLPAGFVWRASDNSDHAFDNAGFLAFFIAAAQWREAAFKVSWIHKANIKSLTTSKDVADYDFKSYWILGYEVTSNGLNPIYKTS
jgi:hypothetical protein